MGVLPPQAIPDPNAPPPLGQFEWYWGKSKGTYAATTVGWMSLHLRRHPVRGTEAHHRQRAEGSVLGARHGRSVERHRLVPDRLRADGRAPYDEYLGLGTDVEMVWWNPDLQTDGSNAVANFPGKGRFMYLNDGKRFSFGEFPKSEPQFFDESASIYQYPPGQAYETGQVPATMPCTGCPSQGGTGA